MDSISIDIPSETNVEIELISPTLDPSNLVTLTLGSSNKNDNSGEIIEIDISNDDPETVEIYISDVSDISNNGNIDTFDLQIVELNLKTTKHFCYLLRSLSSKRTYVGYSTDPWRRLKAHNEIRPEIKRQGAKKTLKGRPWELICFVSGFPDHTTALQFEYAVNHGKHGSYSVPGRIEKFITVLSRKHYTPKMIPFTDRLTWYWVGKPNIPYHMFNIPYHLCDTQYIERQ